MGPGIPGLQAVFAAVGTRSNFSDLVGVLAVRHFLHVSLSVAGASSIYDRLSPYDMEFTAKVHRRKCQRTMGCTHIQVTIVVKWLSNACHK
jgi:hypothetical protein